MELFFLNERVAHYSLSVKLVGKTLFYIVLLGVVILVTYPIAAALEVGTCLGDSRVWERLGEFLVSKTSLATGVQLTMVT